jgi:hypothetical protein
VARSRAERFQGILQAFVHGHRFGVAHHELVRFFRALSTELTSAYEEPRAQASPERLDDRVHEVRRAALWMQRQDLSAYVLLGDPAARLPIARLPAGIHLPAQSGLDTEEIQRREEAVLAVLQGTERAASMASRLGVTRDELERWVEIFVEAGRAALAKTP